MTDVKGQQPLAHLALKCATPMMALALIKARVDLNELNEQGLSILYAACKVFVSSDAAKKLPHLPRAPSQN